MPTQVLQYSKGVANELANRIFLARATSESLQDLLDGANPSQLLPPGALTGPETSGHVGIWKPKPGPESGAFVRDPQLQQDWWLWADVNQIKPKGRRARIVLLGESVARGFFFDPHYTPAQVLNTLLNRSGGPEAEVLDLAKTNMGLPELTQTVLQCQALEPDALVIFAGNNWNYTLRDSLTDQEAAGLAEVMAARGHMALQPALETRMKGLVEAFLATVRRTFDPQRVPVLFVLPEYNLLDWQSTRQEGIASRLPAPALGHLTEARAKALHALGEGRLPEAARWAERMVQLDGSHPEGYEILGRVQVQRQAYPAARDHFERARDTALFGRSTNKPRMLKAISDTLREQCPALGFGLIDLPALLQAQAGGKLPGKEMFLDYCHLTVEGIQVAMRETAARLLEVLGNGPVPPESLPVEDLRPGGGVEALGTFCAAVHNAHYGQPYPVLKYHCGQALRQSPGIADLMRNYADFASRRASTALCSTHERAMTDDDLPFDVRYSLVPKRRMKTLDLELVEAITDALAACRIDIRDHVHQLRKQEHGVMHGKINLLESFYQATSFDRYAGTLPGHYQSRHLESEFLLVADGRTGVRLVITCRTPEYPGGTDAAHLLVNDQPVGSLPAGPWATRQCEVPAGVLRDGVNRIRVAWPCVLAVPPKPPAAAGLPAKEALLRLLFPVFGEIHAFSAEALPAGCPA
jgi:hypothetical protein